MNTKRVEAIANAVLYEGYILYPYRPSSGKNQQRWNFGVCYPRDYCDAQRGSDNWFTQTECLVRGGADTEINVTVRFLQAMARRVGKRSGDASDTGDDGERRFEPVQSVQVGGLMLQTWQEAIEREVVAASYSLGELESGTSTSFAFASAKEQEEVRGPGGSVEAIVIREREGIEGNVAMSAAAVADGVYRVTVCISNSATLLRNATVRGGFGNVPVNSDPLSRDQALMRSLLSTHVILGVRGGEFVSILDPPPDLKEIAAACSNVGTWPVMAGEEGQTDVMLSSPIILYDYPQIASESAGDMFDGTEIDEILALRIMTLTDDEKSEMRQGDDRGRQILERTENMPLEHLMKLHAVLRTVAAPPENGENKK